MFQVLIMAEDAQASAMAVLLGAAGWCVVDMTPAAVSRAGAFQLVVLRSEQLSAAVECTAQARRAGRAALLVVGDGRRAPLSVDSGERTEVVHCGDCDDAAALAEALGRLIPEAFAGRESRALRQCVDCGIELPLLRPLPDQHARHWTCRYCGSRYSAVLDLAAPSDLWLNVAPAAEPLAGGTAWGPASIIAAGRAVCASGAGDETSVAAPLSVSKR